MSLFTNLFKSKEPQPTVTQRARGAANIAAKSIADNLSMATKADCFEIFCRIVEPESLAALVSAFALFPLGIEKPSEFEKFMADNKCEAPETSRTPKISRTANNREELLKGLFAIQFHLAFFNLPPGLVRDWFLTDLLNHTATAAGCSPSSLQDGLNRYLPLLPQSVEEWKRAANPLQKMNPSLMSSMQFEDSDPAILRSWIETLPKTDFSVAGGNAMFGLVTRNNGIINVLAEVATGRR